MINSAPVSYRGTEKAVQEILYKFFSSYFNGQPHTGPDGQPVTFPDCQIAFNDTEIKSQSGSDLTKPLIHIIFNDLRTRKPPKSEGGYSQTGSVRLRVESDLIATIFVKVNATGADNTADFTARQVSDSLVELIRSNQRADLAALGIHHARIPRGPNVISIPRYQARHMTLTASIQYFIPLP